MTTDRTHHKQLAWQENLLCAPRVYVLVARFPADERLALAGQMKRAAISIPTHTAEAAARSSKREFAHFRAVSRGARRELAPRITRARQPGLASAPHAREDRIDMSCRCINGLTGRTRAAVADANH